MLQRLRTRAGKLVRLTWAVDLRLQMEGVVLKKSGFWVHETVQCRRSGDRPSAVGYLDLLG